jgi:hypothetical protein
MALCHLLEAPARLAYPPELWIRVTNIENTYALFGLPIGAAIESLAWILAACLAFCSHKETRTVFLFATLGAALMVLAQVSWWIFVFPVNSEMVNWSPNQIPTNFVEFSKQWEYAHSARALLQILGLGFIVGAIS